jgi:hypothetical protein
MKNKYFIYIAPALMVFFFSCEKEIVFKGNEMKTQLVLNSIVTPDEAVMVYLTESRFFLDDGKTFKKINNATVELRKDGTKIENLSNMADGYYSGTYIPKIGDNLSITASCEGFDPVECSTRIVTPTPVISVDTMNFREEKQYRTYYGTTDIDSSVFYLSVDLDIDITFKDPKDIANYYTVNAYLNYYFSNGENFRLPLGYTSDDMVFQTGSGMRFPEDGNQLKSTLFSDELLDGKEYKLKIKSYNYDGIAVGKPNYPDDSPVAELTGREIAVELRSLSHSYYMFLKTVEASSDMGDAGGYFTEPVQIYTNVKGGIGIFGNYSSSVYTILLK